MALQPRNRITTTFSTSGMADIIFLLLIFFMLTSTLIAPNALKLLLPQSSNKTDATPITSVSITRDLKYYVEEKQVQFNNLEPVLKEKLSKKKNPVISLHVDQSVPMENVVKVMNIAKDNEYKLILATRPE